MQRDKRHRQTTQTNETTASCPCITRSGLFESCALSWSPGSGFSPSCILPGRRVASLLTCSEESVYTNTYINTLHCQPASQFCRQTDGINLTRPWWKPAEPRVRLTWIPRPHQHRQRCTWPLWPFGRCLSSGIEEGLGHTRAGIANVEHNLHPAQRLDVATCGRNPSLDTPSAIHPYQTP